MRYMLVPNFLFILLGKFSLLFFSMYTVKLVALEDIITYELNGGRLGDCIFLYSKAKWLAHQTNKKFYYKPFPYCQNFRLSRTDPLYDKNFENIYENQVKVKNINDITQCPLKPTMFISNLYTFPHNIYELSVQFSEFGDQLRSALSPVVPVQKISLPKDRITVAIHIRKGSGTDKPIQFEQFFNYNVGDIKPDSKTYYQLMFLPNQYYVDQLIYLSHVLNDAPLYVQIFTDDNEPAILHQQLQNAVQHKKNILFAAPQFNNSLIDDIYAIAHFDCLIKSSSHFSLISQLIGNHTIIIYPQRAFSVDNKIIVDVVGTTLRNGNSLYSISHDIRKKFEKNGSVDKFIQPLLKKIVS